MVFRITHRRTPAIFLRASPFPPSMPAAARGTAQRLAGRLALPAALAPHEVDGAVVEDYGRPGRGNAALIEPTSWASFAAAREVGGWTQVRQDRTPGEDTGQRPPQAGVGPDRP